MSRHLNWYKRSPADWQEGTTGFSLELRGFYSAILDAMWQQQGQLPKDDKWLSIRCQCSTRLVRPLIAKLTASGKIIETDRGYYNPRMMADILGLESVAKKGEYAPASEPVQAPFEAGSSTVQPPVALEPASNSGKNPEFSTRVFQSQSQSQNQNLVPLLSTEQGAAREVRTEQSFDLKLIGSGRRALPGRKEPESIENLDASAEGFGLDVQVARELAAKACPAKPYAYRLTLYATELAGKHGIEKGVCREALKANPAARKFVYAVITGAPQ